jgi:hypothetical protein
VSLFWRAYLARAHHLVRSPMGLYPQPDGSTSTFRQGQPKTPDPHPAVSSSLCTTIQSFAVGTSHINTALPTTSTAGSGTGTWTTGTPTGTAASSSNSAASGAGFGGISMALASVVVGALGAGLYIL